MLIKNIRFLTSLKDIEGNSDIENSNIDVFVEVEDANKNLFTYVVVVATPENLESLMDKEKINFLETGDPFIIVKKITKEIVAEAIEAY